MAMYRHVGPPMGGVQAFIRHFRCVACVRLALSLGRALAGWLRGGRSAALGPPGLPCWFGLWRERENELYVVGRFVIIVIVSWASEGGRERASLKTNHVGIESCIELTR